MSLVADLGYTHRRGNAFQRALQAFASTRGGAWFFSKTLARLDRVTERLSHGRVSLPEVLAGLPSLVLTTTGRKSGEQRATHLIAVPLGDTLALLGTNFGQPHTPAWVLNLEADPHASVTYHGVSRAVVARPATDLQREEILANSSGVYGGYQKYQQRITGRRLRMFVLEPAG